MEGRYARAVYDFSTSEPSEISLAVGDVVKIIRQVDANWLCGTCNKQTGNFPASFVVPVEVPPLKPGQKIFLAQRTFPAEEGGDLGFSKGDVILGIQAIDANWWQGSLEGRTGIFPITHVKVLDDTPTPAPSSDLPPSYASVQATSRYSNVPAQPTAAPPQGVTVCGSIAKVRANMDLTAQLDDELSFVMGDIIHVVELIDEDFAIGECHGQRGQFPTAFVEVIEGSLTATGKPEGGEKRKSKSKFRWWLDEEEGEGNGGVFETPPSNLPTQSTSVLTSSNSVHSSHAPVPNGPNGHHQPQNHHHTEASTHPEEKPFTPTHRRMGSYTQENTRSYDSDVTPYGKTLYPFIAENSNELTFFDNEIVKLFRHVDDQWMEGEVDGKRGIFPTAYIEIIVDCPYAEDVPTSSSQEDTQNSHQQQESAEEFQPPTAVQLEQAVAEEPKSSGTGQRPEEKYALVQCSFTPNSERELALTEGDTVTILDQLDEHWFEVKHDDGRVGLCPCSYVRVIESDSCPGTPSPQSESTVELNANPAVAQPIVDNTPVPTEQLMSNRTAPSQEPAAITKVAQKPQPKPKPSLKPKPTYRVRSPQTVEKPIIPPRRGHSVDADDHYVPNPKPVVPARRLTPNNNKPVTVFQKGLSLDTTLDDLIAGEMNALKTTPSDTAIQQQQQRSRSSSATSDYSSIEESRVSGTPIVKPVPETNNNLRSPDEKYMHRGTAVGSSMFFGNNTPPIVPPSSDLPGSKPPLERQRSRPTPNRPPPPPVSHGGLTRQNSGVGGSIRRAPPRPSARPPPASAVTAVPSKLPLGANNMDYGPKPVPSRPAPPRPNPTRPPAPSKSTSANLMDFSPDSLPVTELSEQDREIVADLDNRIAEIQKDLEKCMSARQELEAMMSVTEGDERTEAEESLAFYNANITGLSQEMAQLKGSLYEIQPERARADMAAEQRAAESQRRAEEERRRVEEEKQHREEMRQKRRDTRERVITELLQTERDYLHGLTLTMETFLAPDAEKCSAVDVEVLFGNMDEVIEVSQKLLTSLEGGFNGRDFDKQCIGDSFVTYKEDMKKVYAPYCRNHDDVIALLEKYDESEEVQEYFTRMVEVLRQSITVFDVGSMLIKPVQRILKYPLLLNELIKSTEDEHIDKSPLLNAINAMTDVAAAINEYKRRKDLVLKYRTDRDQKLTDKIARLTVHSTKKKLSRISQRLVGIQTIDETYNREERRVMALEKGARSLVRDIAFYLDQLQETVALQESIANDIADFYGEKSGQQGVEKFCTVHNVIASNLFHAFKFDIEGEVLSPLNHLLMMLSGPAKVMKKRHDKLLDYDNAQGKVKSSKDVELKVAQAELSKVKNDYEALNAQLLDELPRLYDLALDIVMGCITRLAHIQKQFHQKALDEMYNLMSVPLLLGSDDTPLIEAFNIAHTTAVEALSGLAFIPRTFNPRLEEHKPTKASRRISAGFSQATMEDQSQSEGQRVYLTQIYPSDRLHRVITDVPAVQPMDLACSSGTIVGVIKEGDPMGNKERWFVDNGAIKGFIHRRHLAPYQGAASVLSSSLATEPLQPTCSSSSSSGPSPHVSPHRPQSAADLMDLSSPPKETPPATESITATTGDIGDLFQTGLSTLEEKVDLSDTGIQSIDWGLASKAQSTSTNTNVFGYTDQAEPSPPPTYAEAAQPVPPPSDASSHNTYYTAVYSFAARAPIEVSLEEGQVVKVIQQRDLDGNAEWWLVEVNGKQGYAPSNYLYQTTP